MPYVRSNGSAVQSAWEAGCVDANHCRLDVAYSVLRPRLAVIVMYVQ